MISVAVDAGDRAAEHVARRVATGLNGGDADRLQPPPDLRHRADLDPVQLDVLPRGQVEVAVAPEGMWLRTAGVLVGDLADEPGLRRGQPPAGDLHPQHEGVAALPLRVEPDPLQPLRLALDTQDRGRSLKGVAIQHRLLDLQRVPRRFPALDLIQLCVLSSRRRVDHRGSSFPSDAGDAGVAPTIPCRLAVFLTDFSTLPTPSLCPQRAPIDHTVHAALLRRLGLPPPAAGARIVAGTGGAGAGRAADAGESLVVERVVGHVVSLQVLPDLSLAPARQGIELHDAAVSPVAFDDADTAAGRHMLPPLARDPGVEPGERPRQRRDLADLAAADAQLQTAVERIGTVLADEALQLRRLGRIDLDRNP